jgi:hypothetical protein
MGLQIPDFVDWIIGYCLQYIFKPVERIDAMQFADDYRE